MATIAGTLVGMNHLCGDGARQTYMVTANFAAYTGASDDATLAGVGAFIKARKRNGKTHTLRSAMCVGPGYDANSQLVYTSAPTVSTDALNFNLANAAGTELTATSGITREVQLAVTIDES